MDRSRGPFGFRGPVRTPHTPTTRRELFLAVSQVERAFGYAGRRPGYLVSRGNSFRGSSHGLYSGQGLQSDNLTDELRARGLTTVTTVKYIFDTGFTLGGPVKRDTLWFFFSLREIGRAHV